jgi:hypothetical protein
MPDWLWVLLVIVVVLVLLLILAWWWTNRQRRTSSVTARPASTPAPAAAAAAGPYGAGSAAPLSDGSAPAGYTIKGNADSMLYHTLASPYYGRTKAEAWFLTEADAVRAGFKRWDANNPG